MHCVNALKKINALTALLIQYLQFTVFSQFVFRAFAHFCIHLWFTLLLIQLIYFFLNFLGIIFIR